MDKYEYRVKTEQMMEHVEKKQYKKAMEIADTVDWRRVKNTTMLNTVSEIYEFNGEFQKSRDILFVAFDRAPSSRKIVYRLGILALKVQDTEEASDCYEEFVKLAPKDPNQYILKYKILKAQGAPLSEQISALSEFKKAEYVEKWAYELAKLYHEAGMTAECLEECDDLILWFSEGKYVFQAMELKMQYKPLTPLQQEKYDSYGGKKGAKIRRPQAAARPIPKKEDPSAQRPMVKSVPTTTAVFTELPEEVLSLKAEQTERTEQPEEKVQTDETRKFPTGELTKALAAMEAQNERLQEEEAEPEEEYKDHSDTFMVQEEEKRAPITMVAKGATLEEALANGVAMANGINREEKRKMEKREEEIRISGQMKIEDILQEWEEKQKVNAEAIEEQRARDEERLRREREEREARREAERLEAERREAEEVARRKAEEEARKEAERKAAEEAARKEAERRAAEEAARKETERKAAEEAARKEAERKAAEEEARIKAERKAIEAARKEAERKASEEAAKKKNTRKVKKAPVLSDDIRQLVEELEGKVAEEEKLESGGMEDSYQMELDFLINDIDEAASEEKSLGEVADEFEFDSIDGFDEGNSEESMDEFAEETSEEFEEEEFDEDEFEESEDDYDEDEFEESDEDYDEDEFEESDEDYDEDEFEESDGDYDEDEFEESEEDYDEDEFEESDEDYDEDEFEESEEDYDEDEFEESDEDSEDEFDEDDYDEAEFDEDDYDEAEFDEAEFDEEEINEDDFEEEEDLEEEEFDEDELEEEFDEDEFEEEDFFEEEELPQMKKPGKEPPLEIEEPSEEEIQKRIKKSKGSGVPFDTGFVVTGRYDLSATSEIGLKAGLTEEQKKLFSYFVPVRGMSEQIVETLDNDRRAQREGTSKTGNLLVIGRKGSGKTVLAVDIVKAIQKQRNLKQGKVAIVTGESLNKKELSNIIQKLRGGAIIIEKAGKLNSRTIKELSVLMEKKTGEMLFVLEDQRKPLERILTAHPDFKKKFTSKLELPVFINDELVTFGQTYAKENGYKLDEMGILALYSRIDVMQREDHAVTVAEVKDIMDEAIAHSQKANVKHLARRMFGKSTDASDRIILKEEDFKI